MTDQEKSLMALSALQLMAAQVPKKEWDESGYNNGAYVPCPICQKLINIAIDAIKLLEKE